MRGTGHIASPEAEAHRIAYNPITSLLSGATPMPAEYDRRDIGGDIKDQPFSDCVAFAGAKGIEVTGRATGIAIPDISRKQLYAFAQLRDQERLGVPFAERRVRNVGTRFDMLRLALEEHGVASEARCPYEAADFVVQPDGDISIQVPIDVDIAAAVALLTGDYGVDVADAFDVMPKAMIEGHFGSIAIDVDAAFFDTHGPDCEYDGATGPVVGGHAMAILGYRNAVGSSAAGFLLENSYGPDWGDHGYVWLTRNAIARGRDAMVFKMAPVVRA